jgi:hypothetical protein
MRKMLQPMLHTCKQIFTRDVSVSLIIMIIFEPPNLLYGIIPTVTSSIHKDQDPITE